MENHNQTQKESQFFILTWTAPVNLTSNYKC